MIRSHRNNIAWLLVALFLLSASHGILFHADHDHGISDCALCVLAWTMAIASVAVVAIVSVMSRHGLGARGHCLTTRALVYTAGQRAPPVSFLLLNP